MSALLDRERLVDAMVDDYDTADQIHDVRAHVRHLLDAALPVVVDRVEGSVVGGPAGGDAAQPVEQRRSPGRQVRNRPLRLPVQPRRLPRHPVEHRVRAGGGGFGQPGPGRTEQPAVGLDEAHRGHRVAAGPGRQGAVDKVASYIDVGRAEGELVLGGGWATAGELAHGTFFEPTIFSGVRPMDRIGQEEIFGPVLSVIPVDGYGEAMLALNQTRYGLSSSIFTRDVNTAFRAMRDFETGIVYINAGTTGAEVHLPFGGWKETGNGHREAGHVALDTYTEWKSIYVDYSGRLQRAQIDNQPT